MTAKHNVTLDSDIFVIMSAKEKHNIKHITFTVIYILKEIYREYFKRLKSIQLELILIPMCTYMKLITLKI